MLERISTIESTKQDQQLGAQQEERNQKMTMRNINLHDEPQLQQMLPLPQTQSGNDLLHLVKYPKTCLLLQKHHLEIVMLKQRAIHLLHHPSLREHPLKLYLPFPVALHQQRYHKLITPMYVQANS
jgi:hypothetical protein